MCITSQQVILVFYTYKIDQDIAKQIIHNCDALTRALQKAHIWNIAQLQKGLGIQLWSTGSPDTVLECIVLKNSRS